MSMQDGTIDPNEQQLQDMFDMGDGQLNDFDAGFLANDLDLGDFGADANPGYDGSLDTALSPQQTSQIQNVPQPSVELSQHHGQQGYREQQQMDENQMEEQDFNMSGVGAGPLPTGFGVQLPSNVGSTLTDFTKRRNWSARVVEEIRDFLHILTPDGRIMYVSPSAKTLTGHETSSLVGNFMTAFVHPDDNGMYVREFNESIASGNSLRFFFRFRKADDSYRIFESHGHPHFSSDVSNFGGTSHSLGFCRGFFMMARPYPNKNASLLDSFLEHKIENERLKKRIADLKREEQEEMHQQYMPPGLAPSVAMPPGPASRTSFAPSDAAAQLQQQRHTSSSEANVPLSPPAYNGMPPPAKPPISNFALTQRNLDEATAASRPDSINDKMMRYESSNHLDGIEMFTGLRYREGERSKGISTGAMSPMLVRGDQGIEIPPNVARTSRDDLRTSDSPIGAENDKKKKQKITDEYVCTDCGTLDSPEWRRGPNGPKTLCNACGLRWAKQEKKRNNGPGGNAAGNTTKPAPMVPGASGGGAGPGAHTSAGQQQPQQMGTIPENAIGETSGGGTGGDGSARLNHGATQHSGGQAVPAAGSSANSQGGLSIQPAPSQQQVMSGQGMVSQPQTPIAPNKMSQQMQPGMTQSMSGANPMAGAMNVGMQGGISGQGSNNPNQTLSGLNAMDFGGSSVNMDMVGMMGSMSGHEAKRQAQQGGYGDPGGGIGGGGQG